MTLNYTTIILPIRDGLADEIAIYLRDDANPVALDQKLGKLECRPDFPFDKIANLHFCSLLLLPPDGDDCPASLVFEATFDGSRDDFLDAAIAQLGRGLETVLSKCVGYPKAGIEVPDLVKDYMIAHDVGADIFFAGSPGRSVAQINEERRLRSALVRFLSSPKRAASWPTSLKGVQSLVQRQLVERRLKWAELPAVVPWEVSLRWLVVSGFVAGIAAFAAALGALMAWWFGKTSADIAAQFAPNLETLSSSVWHQPWLDTALNSQNMPVVTTVLGLTVLWMALRIGDLILRQITVNPRHESFPRGAALFLVLIFRQAIVVAMIGAVALGVLAAAKKPSGVHLDRQSPVTSYVQKLDRTFGNLELSNKSPARIPATATALATERALPVWQTSALLLMAVVIANFALRYWATSLKLVVEFAELSEVKENVRRFLLDVVRLGIILTWILGVLILARHIPDGWQKGLSDALSEPVRLLIVLAVYLFAGALAVYAFFVLLVFPAIRALEFADGKRFKPAKCLEAEPHDNMAAHAREEGGINRHQNHLASLTMVKPGYLRWTLLWLTLRVVHLLGRFYFNRGELGGIPTILAARWVLIDRGRRLVFLDNYSGAWDSYLNEFIDMGAVKGLNAIWTNTFIKIPPGKRYAFPATRFYLFGGAQDERPFKIYVRQSQIETIVWYGAYPMLGIRNVNANTDIRQAVFKPLAEHELDEVMQLL